MSRAATYRACATAGRALIPSLWSPSGLRSSERRRASSAGGTTSARVESDCLLLTRIISIQTDLVFVDTLLVQQYYGILEDARGKIEEGPAVLCNGKAYE